MILPTTRVVLWKHLLAFPLVFKIRTNLIQIRVGMSVGHHPDHEQHTGDMQKSHLTSEEKHDAQVRITGGVGNEPQSSSIVM